MWGARGAGVPGPEELNALPLDVHVQLHRCDAHEALERRHVLYVDWAHVDQLS